MQRKYFSKETLDLSQRKFLNKTLKIYSLNLELDMHGLLRLERRFHFSDLDVGEKHPRLLPNKDRYSELAILHAHNKLFHAGVEATLAQVRERFWNLIGRQCAKSILNECFLCKKIHRS
ncbi:integrase catalytic domain-containing protein [Trichonephila inaurata madagascariensis]|uniref:Integrase catalytic domain-containing protein n=1 Tax=Trichonephila inaurata madagascariensis TaxID=2747483 RepID=A0A8X6JHL8_9ARAC|nr:integrase catalytic domain-containing protein [Trichonephila inaurata madagascariensis]